ncbi:hypothetical protein BUALT_Bualt09G0011400 [Buddleja alternifolia]|uniref:UBX domain-containing protein n=1 Tax=Buddleja alternifolia TaxID=168488 RepID=A0AAV6X5L9_9LAMI|nr:hypothetical protein BUALT_Bualt09G0011400 [Buddleja alternifolia]
MKMEQSLSSLAFRGSIVEAIAEAKRQKKLFVVYASGDNPNSKHLETSTWVDPNVCEALAKYCILLHILERSSEASNFSAIYPQHSAPCITAIGYNGVQLWQKEGFVSADILASSLEKAWLNLHFQETTAAFLTAALVSGTGPSNSASSEQVTTPRTYVSSPLIDNDDASKERDSKRDDMAFPKPSPANMTGNGQTDESATKTETGNTSCDPVEMGQNNFEVASPLSEKDLDFGNNHFGSGNEVSQEIVDEASKAVHVNTQESTEVEKADASDFFAFKSNDASDSSASKSKSNDVSLNIRLPDGISLQVKFSVMDTLKMVKDYIIENQKGGLGSFSIAIPYPRKVFNDQDLRSTLSELGLFNRQALVVVPNNQNNMQYRGETSHYLTSSSNDVGSPNGSEGYWGYLRRILSYVNPFSYLSTSASSTNAAQESQTAIWEYGRPSIHSSDHQSTRDSKSRQQTSRFGANIHTLKHDDDEDSRFNDRNAFWNGNSTQFGGNDNDDGK